MTPQELFKAGRLNDAVAALTNELRTAPTDTKRRTFLFELLCFAGEYDRAERQLEALSRENSQAEMGALIYRAALHAERMRQEMFSKKTFPMQSASSSAVRGSLNGNAFESLEDCDPRVGANLELYVAGSYTWLPFSLISSIDLDPPKRLRDLLWAPLRVKPSAAYQGREIGEVMTPVLSPGSWQHADDAVRLGRISLWEEPDGADPVPLGQKMLLVDGEQVPLLEVRRIEIAPPEAA